MTDFWANVNWDKIEQEEREFREAQLDEWYRRSDVICHEWEQLSLKEKADYYNHWQSIYGEKKSRPKAAQATVNEGYERD